MKYIHTLDSQRDNVVLLEIRREPFNYVNLELISELADTLEVLDRASYCRCVVIAAQGRAFCAGADFSDGNSPDPTALYTQAMRLYRTQKPMVAAVHGAAAGAGLGLAVTADFRVTCGEARFSASFNRLGFHPGFGLSVTLPRLVGAQQASLLFYTGRRISGEEAVKWGLADMLVSADQVRTGALDLAAEIATSAPLAVTSTRATLREGLADEIQRVNQHELHMQKIHYATEDFKEGVAAMAERRKPVFQGR